MGVGCGNWKPKHGIGPYCANCGFHESEHGETHPYTRAHPMTETATLSSNPLVAELRANEEGRSRGLTRRAADEIERLTALQKAWQTADEVHCAERDRLHAQIRNGHCTECGCAQDICAGSWPDQRKCCPDCQHTRGADETTATRTCGCVAKCEPDKLSADEVCVNKAPAHLREPR